MVLALRLKGGSLWSVLLLGESLDARWRILLRFVIVTALKFGLCGVGGAQFPAVAFKPGQLRLSMSLVCLDCLSTTCGPVGSRFSRCIPCSHLAFSLLFCSLWSLVSITFLSKRTRGVSLVVLRRLEIIQSHPSLIIRCSLALPGTRIAFALAPFVAVLHAAIAWWFQKVVGLWLAQLGR